MSNCKRMLALIMVIAFVIALASCGKEEKKETEPTTKATTVASDETTVTTKKGQTTTKSKQKTTTAKKANKVTAPTVPAGQSKTLKLITRTTNKGGNASAKFVSSLKGYSLKIYYPWNNIYGTTQVEKSAKWAISQVQNEYGVKISEDGEFNNYNESLASMLAARNCKSQVYYVQNMNFASYFQNNYISNLNTAMRESGVDFKDPWYISAATGFLNINANQYGWIPFEDEYTMPFCIAYNKTLLQSKKLADPAALAEKGQWTWDKLKTYSKRFDNDSKKGFVCAHTEELLANIANQNGTALSKVKKMAEPASNISSNGVQSALKTLQEWTYGTNGKNNWCDTYKGQSWNQAKSDFASGKIAMLYATHDDIQILAGASTSNDFGIAPFPTKKGTKSYTNIADPQFICFIPAQFQSQASKILFIRNEYYRYNYCYVQTNFGLKWKKFFDSSAVLDDACNIKYARKGNKTVFNWVSVCEKSSKKKNTTAAVISDVISGKSPATAISSYKSAIMNNYSDVWKGYKITGNV